MRKAVDVNLTAFVYLTALFLETFGLPCRRDDRPPEEERARGSVVINVSSLAAVQPFESWAMYCAGASLSLFLHIA